MAIGADDLDGLIDPDEFWSQYIDWQRKVFNAYSRVGDENFDVTTRFSMQYGSMLNAMAYKDVEGVMYDYRRMIGFDTIYDKIAENLDIIPGGGGRPYGKLRIDPDFLASGDPRAHILAGLNVQIRTDAEGNVVHSIGRNIESLEMAQARVNPPDLGAGLVPGSRDSRRALVIDVESAGLSTESGVRQISAYTMDITKDRHGNLKFSRPQAVFDEHMATVRMQFGESYDPVTGSYTSIMDKTRPAGRGFYNTEIGSGDDFASAMRRLGDAMGGSDFIVGHNVGFDIDQIFRGLGLTSAYKENTPFKSVLDSMRARFNRGRVVDTANMAARVLPDMITAPELAFQGSAVRHSLENILLQSNLLELMAPEMGGKQQLLNFIQSGGMHSADVDTLVESYLMRFANEFDDHGEPLLKAYNDPNAPLRHVKSKVDWAIRNTILRSQAPTPITKIKDVRDISPDMFERLLQQHPDRISVFDYNTGSALNLASFNRPGSLRELHAALSGDEVALQKLGFVTPSGVPRVPVFASAPGRGVQPSGFTYLEQQIINRRQLLDSSAAISEDDLMFNMRHWREFSGISRKYEGFLNADQSLFNRGVLPGASELGAFQQRLAQAGIPWAGADIPERWLTHAIASAGADPTFNKYLGGLEGRVAKISSELGVGRWKSILSPYLSTDQTISSLPLDILREAEREGIIRSNFEKADELTKLRISVENSRKDSAFANLIYDFEGDADGQAKQLADWLEAKVLSDEVAGQTMETWGFTEDSLSKISKAIRDHGTSRGIVVGRLHGKSAEAIRTAMENLHPGSLEDTALLPFRVGFMDSTQDFLRTGAVFLDTMFGQTEQAHYLKDMSIARDRLLQLEKIAVDKLKYHAAQMAFSSSFSAHVQRGMEIYGKIRSKAPAALGIAAVLGVGAWYAKHRSEEEFWDDTIEQQPIERQYVTGRPDIYSAPPPSSYQIDPLVTAGVVGNLDRGRTNHTLMDARYRNQHLYQGAL